MATKEVDNNTNLLKNDTSSKFDHAKQFLDCASELLLFRRFEDCIKTCTTGILKAKLENNGNPMVVEALCVLGIQAYAELNNWQHVLPFVQKVYTSIEDCPFRVIQLCILLHAKVEEYSQCYAVASIWLKNVKNFSDPNYLTLVEIYIINVLLPKKQHNLIDAFLDACPGLDSEQRKIVHNNFIKDEITSSDNNTPNPGKHPDSAGEITEVKDSLFLKVIRNIKFAILGDAPLYSFRLIKITVIAVCLYLVSIQNQKGFLIGNFEKVGILFQGMVKVFKSLFGQRTYITR